MAIDLEVAQEKGYQKKVDAKDPARVLAVAILRRVNGLHAQLHSAGEGRRFDIERQLSSALKEAEERSISLIFNEGTNRYRLPKTEAAVFEQSSTSQELAKELATHFHRQTMEVQIELHNLLRSIAISADAAAGRVVEEQWEGGSTGFDFTLVHLVHSLIGKFSLLQDIQTELLGQAEPESELVESSES